MDSKLVLKLKEANEPCHNFVREDAENLADYLFVIIEDSDIRMVAVESSGSGYDVGLKGTFDYITVLKKGKVVEYTFNVRASKDFVAKVNKALKSVGYTRKAVK